MKGSTAAASRLLSQALSHVPDHGWTNKALALAATDLGLSPAAAGLPTHGAIDLVHHFMETSNRDAIKAVATTTPIPEAVNRTATIRAVIRGRLEKTLPYLDRWPQAMALGALPPNCFQTWRILGSFIDDAAHIANDRTVGVDWYTSRAALASVYVATELFLLTDRSEGQAGTWQFLDDQLRAMASTTLLPDQLWRYGRTATSLLSSSIARAGSSFCNKR